MTQNQKGYSSNGKVRWPIRFWPSKPKKATPSFYLFLPGLLNKSDIIRWLKRVHAWTGFWGAAAFLLLGVSGVLLNHKAIWKIDTGAPKEVMAVTLPVEAGAIKSIEDLGAWGQAEFDIGLRPFPRRSSAARSETVVFLGKEVAPEQIWKQRFFAPNAILELEYVEGASHVQAVQSAQNGWGLIKNLHKSTGVGLAWVLLMDTMAGALIAMTLTGMLLWSRLHGPRLVAIAIGLGSFALLVFAATQTMV